MRIGIYVALLAGIGVVVAAAVAVLVLASESTDQIAAAVLGLGIAGILLAPLVHATVTATWDVEKDASELRRWRIGAGVTVAVGVAAIIVGGALAGTAPWAIVVVALLGIGSTLAAEPIGRRIARASRRRARPTPPALVPLEEFVRTTLRRTALVVGIGFALVLMVALPFDLLRDGDDRGMLTVTAAGFPLLAGALLVMFRGWNEGAVLRGWFDRDAVLARRVGKATVTGDDRDLSDDERVLAARWAVVSPTLGRLQLFGYVLLWMGLIASQVPNMLRNLSDSPVFLVISGALILAVAIAVPSTLRRLRRIDRYAESHRHLLEGAG